MGRMMTWGLLAGILFVSMGAFFGAAFASMIFGTNAAAILIGAVIGVLIFPCMPLAFLWWRDGGRSLGL